MSEYWKSTPKYWCKHCSVYVRDTKLERSNHESTGKHQGAIKRSLRDLHRSAEQKERDQDRAKREVERLNGLVSRGGSSSTTTRSGAAPSYSNAPPKEQKATEAERQRQLEQLAELGVSLPTEVRTNLAMPGEWTTTSTRIIGDPNASTAEDKDDAELDALLSGPLVKTKKEEEKEGVHQVKKVEEGQDETVTEEGRAAKAEEGVAAEYQKDLPPPPIKKEPSEEDAAGPLGVAETKDASPDLPAAGKTDVEPATVVQPGLIPDLRGYLTKRASMRKKLRRKLQRMADDDFPPYYEPPTSCMLVALPDELLLMVTETFSQSDLLSIGSTCRRLAAFAIPTLYIRDITEFDCLALRWACTFGICPTIERALAYGAPVDHIFHNESAMRCSWVLGGQIGAEDYDTPLKVAIGADEHEAVRLLCARGADVNRQDNWPAQRTIRGNPRIIACLLDAGANPNQLPIDTWVSPGGPSHQTALGPAPLFMAMDAGVPADTVQLLLERGASTDLAGFDFGRWKVQLLIAYGGVKDEVALNLHLQVPAMMPLLYGCLDFPEIVKLSNLFMAEGLRLASLSKEYGIPPIWAVLWWGESRINANSALATNHYRDAIQPRGSVFLNTISTIGATMRDLVTLMAESTLVDRRAGREVGSHGPAVRTSVIIDEIINDRIKVTARKKNQTPLRYVCSPSVFMGASSLIPLLLEFGADLNGADDEGITALHRAAMFTSEHHIRALVDFRGGPATSGLVIDPRDKGGWTPLHYACQFGFSDEHRDQAAAARVLLDNKADVHARTNSGRTALMIAIQSANRFAVELLLDFGATHDDLLAPSKAD
ncbi:hypothetical protein B0H63DRAFT_376903, partial [Podospora didyma]